MKRALSKKPLVLATILLVVFTAFLCYEYTWGFLAPKKPPQPDFEVSADPELVTLRSWEGSSNSTVIIVRSVAGFSGKVTMEVGYTYLIGDVRLTLSSSEVTLQQSGQAYCLLTFYSITPIKTGEYYVEVVGKAGDLEHSVRVTLKVTY